MSKQSDIQRYQSVIKVATVLLVAAQVILLGLFFSKMIDKSLFQIIFAGVFVVYALVATVVTLAISNASNRD